MEWVLGFILIIALLVIIGWLTDWQIVVLVGELVFALLEACCGNLVDQVQESS